MPVCFDLKLKELCNSFDFVNIPKINIWLIKVRGFIPVYSRAHVLCLCQLCQPHSCPSSGLWPTSCVPWVVWRLLKREPRLSCGQVSQHKGKLPSKECNKRDPLLNSIKQLKLNARNETKGVPTPWTIGCFFANLPFAFYEQVPGVVRPAQGILHWQFLSTTQELGLPSLHRAPAEPTLALIPPQSLGFLQLQDRVTEEAPLLHTPLHSSAGRVRTPARRSCA